MPPTVATETVHPKHEAQLLNYLIRRHKFYAVPNVTVNGQSLTLKGKVNLTVAEWQSVTSGNEGNYHFFSEKLQKWVDEFGQALIKYAPKMAIAVFGHLEKTARALASVLKMLSLDELFAELYGMIREVA